MQITPYILGSGKAATAIIEALALIEIIHPEITFLSIHKIKRGQKQPDVRTQIFPVLFIANPHGLHASAIIEGAQAGFKLIVCEKPVAINLEQINQLRNVSIPVAVLHVYRQTWGIKTLKNMIEHGELGEVICVEGRYWQSSSAQKALTGQKSSSWKNNPELSGPSDVLVDLASHWADAAQYLLGATPVQAKIWRSYVNAEASHRETHVHLSMDFPYSRAFCSISKTVHGHSNHFEINLIGSKKYAAWKFLEPDILEISQGSTRTFKTRDQNHFGSGHWPNHGVGWLEGYVEIIYQALIDGEYPTLNESLPLMENILSAS